MEIKRNFLKRIYRYANVRLFVRECAHDSKRHFYSDVEFNKFHCELSTLSSKIFIS